MKNKKGANNTYFGNIWEGIRSSFIGLKISIRHAWQAIRRRTPVNVDDASYFQQKTGIVTLQYPYEAIPVPDHGRYRLYNEMDDCIVCDKCAKICPVNCIDIQPIRATEQVGTASDGSPIRLYAETFDIDMAKCCYCGLCTTVCPTDCLTMTKAYDYSETDITNMVYHFANLSPEEAQEKKELLTQFQKEKEEAKKQAQAEKAKLEEQASSTSSRPKFKPKMKAKPATDSEKADEQKGEEKPATPKPRPKFKPKMKAKPVQKSKPASDETADPDHQESSSDQNSD